MPETKVFTKRFDPGGAFDFEALSAATKWLDQQGYSRSPLQRGFPIALKRGLWEVAKWGNLTPEERRDIDGTITPEGTTFRGNAAVVTLYDFEEAGKEG